MINNKQMNPHLALFVLVAGFAGVLYVAPDAQAAEAQCSSDYNGEYFSEKPEVSDKLCSSGSAGGSLQGDGSESNPWKWHCYDAEGNEGERCEAFKDLCGNGKIDEGEQCDGQAGCSNSCEMTAQCGSSADAVLESKPSSNLCKTGTPSGSIEGDGSESNPWKWHCYDFAGNQGDKCNATKAVEPAQCGSSADAVLESKPSSNLCETGNPSGSVEGDGSESNPWKWHCYDSAGNQGDKCTATEKVEEVVVEEEKEEVVEESESVVPGGEVVEEEKEEEVVVEEKEEVSFEAAAPSCSTSEYADIKGYIYHDDNRNGRQDAGEKGIKDVRVELRDDAGKTVAEDETNSDGKFKFENFAPGKYVIDVHSNDRQLDGYTIVSESDNNRNERDSIRLKCDNNHTGTLFGYDTGEVAVEAGKGGDGSYRPTTLAQTGGSFWSMILSLLTK